VEWEIGAPGKAYTQWAAQMAVALDTGVPWIMCKHDHVPDPIVRPFCSNPFKKKKKKETFVCPTFVVVFLLGTVFSNIVFVAISFIVCSTRVIHPFLCFFIGKLTELPCIFVDRLTPAMDTTVKTSFLTRTTNPKCGQRTGLAGMFDK